MTSGEMLNGRFVSVLSTSPEPPSVNLPREPITLKKEDYGTKSGYFGNKWALGMISALC